MSSMHKDLDTYLSGNTLVLNYFSLFNNDVSHEEFHIFRFKNTLIFMCDFKCVYFTNVWGMLVKYLAYFHA
jgi:hypothetical protein